MKHTYLLLSVIFGLNACTTKMETPEVKEPSSLAIEGIWKLIAGITIQENDTTFTDYTNDQETIKIINKSHFAFLTHDLNRGKDADPVFVAGGGTYSLLENRYTEHLAYCNYREWENRDFDFELSLQGDTLIQTGIEKVEALDVDRKIIETYVKLER